MSEVVLGAEAPATASDGAATTSEGAATEDTPPPAVRTAPPRRRLPVAPILIAVEIAIILVIWQVAQGTLELVPRLWLPAPSDIAQELATMAEPGYQVTRSGDLYAHIYSSLSIFFVAFTLAALAGIPFGLFIGSWFPAQKLIAPIVWALYAMPLIAIRPMTPFWFGLGNGPIIFLVFLAALLPITLNTAAGVNTVDPVLRKSALVFGATRLQVYRKVVLPSTVPFILTGLRLGVIIAWIILLISEMTGAPRGFGAIFSVALSRFAGDTAFAAIVILVVISVLMVQTIGVFENRVSSWRPRHD
jgi:ABC-type nitrate/sulfonate/bicarbonate transport system permease component